MEVIEICAAVGDVLAAEDPVIVIESDKASMELPAPAAGTLNSLLVAVGDRIGEGHVVGTIDAAQVSTDEPAVAQATSTDAPGCSCTCARQTQ